MARKPIGTLGESMADAEGKDDLMSRMRSKRITRRKKKSRKKTARVNIRRFTPRA